MATLRIDHNKFEPLLIDTKDLSYGKVSFNPRTTVPPTKDSDEYLQIIFNDDYKPEKETILQISTTEIEQLYHVIHTFLLPRIRATQESNESNPDTV